MPKPSAATEQPFATVGHHLSGLIGSLVGGYVETVATIADAADRVAVDFCVNDPSMGAATSGDVLRQMPRMVGRTASKLNDEFMGVQQRLADLFDPCGRDFTGSGSAAFTDERGEAVPERRIVAAVRDFIRRSPQQGVTLSGLMKQLHAVTPYTDDELRSVLGRRFTIVDNELVFDTAPPAGAAGAPLAVESVEEHLRALGYTDLRRDVLLEPSSPHSRRAPLVAYAADMPVVLVSIVSTGMIDDPMAIESVSFQAKLLGRSGHAARYAYLTDRRSNRYVDLHSDTVIAELPRATATAAKPKA